MPLIAKTPYDPALTGIGLLKNGKVSDSGRARFVEDVVLLLTLGNRSGRTLAPIASLFPLPPIPGPVVPNLNILHPGTEPIFWFEPDPAAALLTTTLLDKKKTAYWHTIFVDTLYDQTAVALDLAGNTPLFPIFDVSAPFGIDLPIPFTLPELAAKLSITPPELAAKLVDLNIKLSPPSLSIPTIPVPTLPKLPPLPLLPDLLLGLFTLPFKLLIKLVVPPKIDILLDIPNLPKAVFTIAFDLLLDLFKELGLPSPFPLLPKAFVASIIVYLKNVVAMVCVDLVAQLVGTGAIAHGVGLVLGLVSD